MFDVGSFVTTMWHLDSLSIIFYHEDDIFLNK